MSEENVFHWDTDKLYSEGLEKLPKWARKDGSCITYGAFPRIVPGWVRDDYQVGYDLLERSYANSTTIILYVRIRFSQDSCSKWMPYINLLDRDFYLIPDIVEYLLSGNAERVYESFVKERKWKNRRIR